MTELLLKKHFPDYKINNSSKRSKYTELVQLLEIAMKIDKLIIFLERNEKNDKIFKAVEISNKCKFDIHLIIIHLDNMYWFSKNDKYEHIIQILKRNINNDNECVICLEKCAVYSCCCKCGAHYCEKCFDKYKKIECALCKSNRYIFYNNNNYK